MPSPLVDQQERRGSPKPIPEAFTDTSQYPEGVSQVENRREVAIEARNLTKSYGRVDAVRGVDLEVRRGEVFAMLGPNGAGKTTTVEMLEGHRSRTGGEARVLGFDPARGERDFKQRIGIVLQETGVQPYLTVEEAIEMYRGYYPEPLEVGHIIELVGLEGERTRRVNRLSGGQKRRLDVGIGLAGDPDLLFLDEPTTGFDPSARRNAWQMFAGLQRLGKTIFLTTHYMEEAQRLADRVAIIVDGTIIAVGAPETLAGDGARSTTVSFRLTSHQASLPEGIGRMAVKEGDRVTVRTGEPVRLLRDLTGWALDRHVELEDLSVTRPSLEDVYLQLTSEAERPTHE